MRIHKPISLIRANWPLAALALLLLSLIAALGISAGQHPAIPPAASQPTLAPPEPPRPAPRSPEITLPVEVIVAPEAAPEAEKPLIQYQQPRRLFRRRR